MRKTWYLLAGVVTGAVVGAAAALLLTPYSGAEIQQQIRTRAQGLLDEGKKAAVARRDEMKTQLEAFKRGKPTTETTPEQAQV